jgi:hypothetical protein
MTMTMAGEWAYVLPEGTAPSARLVSSIRVWRGPTHDLVRVWCRGGFAGALILTHGDGALLAAAHGLVLSVWLDPRSTP